MTRWTPADGPLTDALKDLPDGHPVTITIIATYRASGRIEWAPLTKAVSAEWEPPAPAWDGALVIQDVLGAYWVRLSNGNYATHAAGDLGVDVITLAHSISGVRVLIDADGNYPGTDPCNRGACAAPLGHEGTCAEASGWEMTDD